MGNNFVKFFKKEEDEISDIRHYLEYLNQEKKRNFEPLAESRKTQTSVSTKPAYCDLSNCVNLLAFNKKTISWKDNLLEECRILARSFEWGKIITKELRNFEGNNDHVFQMEITWIMNNSSNVPFDPPKKSHFSMPRTSSKKSMRSRGNSTSKEKSKISIGQINVPPSPQESFIVSKKYAEDYNFFDSSMEIPNGDPFSVDDSNIPLSPDEKNVGDSFNNISSSSDLFFIQYPKTVLTYENNTFLLPKLSNDMSDLDSQNNNTNKHVAKSSAFLDKFNMEKIQPIYFEKEREKYKMITKTIERHLKDPKNCLCFIKTKYTEYFLEKYEEFAFKQYENNREIKTLEMICESMMKDLRQFIRVFKDSVYYFYRINEICVNSKNMEYFFTLDNMINFVLSILFIEEVYSTVFEIQRKLDYQKEMTFKKNLKKLKNGKPEDFGVADKFCLNKRTISYFKQKNKHKGMNQDSQNMKLLDENEEEIKDNSTDTVETLSSEPYAKAIDCIKNIQFLKSPTHKLKAILASSEKIMESIDDFYKKINVKFNKDIDPDDIMTIYIYMISKSTLTTLITHCNLIEKFLTESSLASISGYYFVTLNASIDYIINLKEEKNKPPKVDSKSEAEEEKKGLNERKSQITNSASNNLNEERVEDMKEEKNPEEEKSN